MGFNWIFHGDLLIYSELQFVKSLWCWFMSELQFCEAPSLVMLVRLLLDRGLALFMLYRSHVMWIYEWRIITVITHGRIMSHLGLTWVLLPLNCKEISSYPFLWGDHRRILDAVPHARCWLFILSNEALAADFGFIWVIKPGSPRGAMGSPTARHSQWWRSGAAVQTATFHEGRCTL